MENKQNIKDLIQKFYPHAKEKLGFDHPVRVIMRQDAENAQQSLGKTAYYDPAEKLIVLYVTDRHPKDVLRSFSHELVHHAQNCRGELDDLSTDAHYAKDGKGREIEEEAYLQGNLNLRDYEDSIKFEGVNEMKLTKSQLKGLIEQTIEKITEKKFPDLTGDGKVTQADILKGRGVKLKEKEHENDSALDDDGFDAFRDAFKSVTGDKEGDSEKEKNRERFRAVARAAERTKEKREEDGEMDEQEMVVKADVTLTGEAKRIIDMFDNFLNQADVEGAEMEAVVAAIMQKLQDKGVEYADPSGTLDMDEISPVPTPIPNRDEKDDDLGEQEMKPTIKGKKIKIEKEPKDPMDPVIKIATDKRKDKEKFVAPSDPAPNLEENNETWYNSSLYESLKSKWTK
tara:strand:- start:732 stop:1928 length:1197 start_codon:yes stop_codon:yes gene_type:complete